jgi:hypothetical protein
MADEELTDGNIQRQIRPLVNPRESTISLGKMGNFVT